VSHTATRLRRPIYVGLGWCAVALGLVGVFVPGMPTTVFVLVASYFFARSSPRYEAWLRANRYFGPVLRRFCDAGGMTSALKATALASMWTAIAVSSVALAAVSPTASLVTVSLGGVGTLTILFAVRTVS